MIRNGFDLVWEHSLDLTEQKAKEITQMPTNFYPLLKSVLDKACDIRGETFVIKITEDIFDNDELLTQFAENVSLLTKCGVSLMIIHDYGQSVYKTLQNFNVDEKFIDGFRVADHKTAALVEMVLCGHISKKIVAKLCMFNCKAIGISGKDANLIQARNMSIKSKRSQEGESIIDFGFIGEPVMINPEILIEFEDSGIIPVISPVAFGLNGSTHLVNTDLTAAIVASALSAEKLIYFSKEGSLIAKDISIPFLSVEELRNKLDKSEFNSTSIGIAEAAASAIANSACTVYVLPSINSQSLLESLLFGQNRGTIIAD